MSHIAKITLDEKMVPVRNFIVENERTVAIHDLLAENSFQLHGKEGPYHVHLGLRDHKLVMEVACLNKGEDLDIVQVPLRSFRTLIKDYFIICDSYYEAVNGNNPAKIEAIDMGRRAIHNEASELLQERLADKVICDHDTARRLFTLLCVLQFRG